MTTETIDWKSKRDEYPDAEQTVLVSLTEEMSEPTGMAWTDGKSWFDAATGGEIGCFVTHWAQMPQGVRA